jgi:hypothetical protein
MWVHLWTKGPAPLEYIELVLCREFGCRPSELRQERAVDLFRVLDMMNVEAKVREKRAPKRRR